MHNKKTCFGFFVLSMLAFCTAIAMVAPALPWYRVLWAAFMAHTGADYAAKLYTQDSAR